MVFRSISEPNLLSKWWKARLYNLNIFFPSPPFKLAGAFAASTGSETKVKFSLRLAASVQSGMCGCKSVNMNLTALLLAMSGIRGERGIRPLLVLETEFIEVVNGDGGTREDRVALRSFSMKGVGPPAPAQKSTYVYRVTSSARARYSVPATN